MLALVRHLRQREVSEPPQLTAEEQARVRALLERRNA